MRKRSKNTFLQVVKRVRGRPRACSVSSWWRLECINESVVEVPGASSRRGGGGDAQVGGSANSRVKTVSTSGPSSSSVTFQRHRRSTFLREESRDGLPSRSWTLRPCQMWTQGFLPGQLFNSGKLSKKCRRCCLGLRVGGVLAGDRDWVEGSRGGVALARD